MRYSPRNGAWTPILTESLRDEAIACVLEIANVLRHSQMVPDNSGERAQLLQNPTLAGGTAGISLFFGYLAKGLGDSGWEADAIAYLDEAIDEAPRIAGSFSLYEGLLGVGWTYSHLLRSPNPEYDDAVSDVDELLLRYLRRHDDHGGVFDLIVGQVGMGVYALERLPSPHATEILSLVIDHLANLAVVTEGGVCWHTPSYLLRADHQSKYTDGVYNLGVAHGQPGVIALLAASCRAGVRVDLARPLLDGAVNWLLHHQLPEESPSVFGTWVAAAEPPKPARSAWCYGDPGVAATLLVAARCVEQPQWEAEAQRIARKATMRDRVDAGVRDTCLCHGAAGLGHLFNRLYQATGDSDSLEAARFWFARTLEMRRPGTGIAGFRNYGPDPGTMEDTLVDYHGFLMGAAGIGLALLGAVTSVEPSWDRVMALSVPGPSGCAEKEAARG